MVISTLMQCGRRSAPKIFTAVADALEWGLLKKAWNAFITTLMISSYGPPRIEPMPSTLKALCAYLGVPLAPEKKDGPSPVLIFLSIIIDTIRGKLGLQADKLQRLLDTVLTWLSKRTCTRWELESIIGTLQHACKIIHQGRSFLCRTIILLSVAKRRNSFSMQNSEQILYSWKIWLFGSLPQQPPN